MMKFLQTMKKAETLKKENEKLNIKMENLIDQLYPGTHQKTYRTHQEIEKGNTELAKLQEKIILNNIKIKILVNNSKYDFVQETKPLIIEVLEKYNGKKYGEVTKKKIHDEIFNKYHFYFYMNESSHNSGYSITPENTTNYYYSHRIEINTPYDTEKILIDNTINIEGFKNANYTYYKYIEDINGHAKSILRQYKKVQELNNKYYQEISEYNNLINLNCDGLKNLDYPQHLYNIDYYFG